jgi:uncharacterized protein involved in outer membrane biogenesis
VKRWSWRRLPRPVRIGAWALLGVIVLVVVAGGVFVASFDPNSMKPRVIAAVKQQTGRDLAINGTINLGLSLRPTVVLHDVTLSNPPGFSRPQMASLQSLDLQLALLPLIGGRVEINRLVLTRPDILLETNAKGGNNWELTPETKPAQQPAASPSGSTSPTEISIALLRIDQGTIALRDDKSGETKTLAITRLDVRAPDPNANLKLDTSASYGGTAFTLAGEVGSLNRLQDAAATTAWPVHLTLAAAGAKIGIDGTMTHPMQGKGYTLKLAGSVPDVAALAPLYPGAKLPPLHDVSFAAQVADSGAAMPIVSSLTLSVGKSDLSSELAGLQLEKLDVAAARLDQPLKVTASGSLKDQKLVLAATMGAPAALFAGGKSLPLEANVQAGDSSLTFNGTAALAGNRPVVQATAKSPKINADALLTAMGMPVNPPTGNAPAPPAPKAASGRMIPDTPIPFDTLRAADADLTLNIDQFVWGGATYKAIAAHLVLKGGNLRVDPFSADLPEGKLDGALSADASQSPPRVAVRLHAPGLAVAPLLAAAGMAGYASGNLEVHADVRGAGNTPHAIASTLDGPIGVDMVNGKVDNRLLGSTLGSILREVNLLDLVGRGGVSDVQCFAMKLTSKNGVAAVQPLVLSSTLLTMDGEGSVNLGNETVALHVRPQAKVIGTGLVVPLVVNGPLRSPSVTPDPAAAVTQNAGTVAGAVITGATPLGLIAGAVGGKQLLGGSGVDCGPALAAARGGAMPAAASSPQQQAAPQQPAPAQKPKQSGIGGVLNQLFR